METKITKNTVATLFLMSAMALNVQSQTTLTWGRQIGTEEEGYAIKLLIITN